MLKVRVGKDLKLSTFIVHQDLLTERSEFFRRVTAGVWQQVHDEYLVTLPDDDEHIFRLYFNLVYAGQLGTRGADEWTKLSRLFVLAEKLVDLTAKNQIVDGMHAFFNELVKKNPTGLQVERILPAAATKQLYEGTPERSQARKLIVDLYAGSADESWLRDSKSLLPEEFVYDVAIRLLQKRPSMFNTSISSRPSSSYHDFNVPDKPSTQAVVTITPTKPDSGTKSSEVATTTPKEEAKNSKAEQTTPSLIR
jgi:hypothetical protein